MSKNTTPVSAREIRQAYANGDFDVPEGTNIASLVGRNGDGRVRGRLNPAVVEAYLGSKAGKGRSYAEKSVAEAKMVTLPLTKPNAKGARLKRPEAFPISEVRALAGAPAKGRLSEKHLLAAAERVQESRGW
jgi:hypothetical protein